MAQKSYQVMAMLRLEHLARPGLQPVSLRLPTGACGVVMGPSGAGKTLLARAIVDLDPNDGEAFWKDRARSAMPACQWRRLISYVPAQSGWWADRVGDHFPKPVDAETLSAVNLPPDAPSWPVVRLSSGEKQRLALLRALAAGPDMLILDEPTAALDDETKERVEALLRQCLNDGLTLLLITHDKAQAKRLGRHFWRIDSGRLTEGGP